MTNDESMTRVNKTLLKGGNTMVSWPICDVCGFSKYGCVSVCVLISTMGSRADRRQKSTPSAPSGNLGTLAMKATKVLTFRIRQAIRALKSPEKLIKLSSLSPRRS